MQSNYDKCLETILHHEGGYVNHPKDPGGETNLGVTKRVYEEHGGTKDMKDLTVEDVAPIYKKGYWDKMKGDELPGGYWKELAEYWDTTEEAAKKSLCGNCVAFDISPRMKECMPGEVSDDSGVLGYCWMHNFKCHSARTCRTWAKGGPIKKDSVSYDWQERKEK